MKKGAAENRSLTRSTVQGVFWITAGRFLKAPVNLLAVAVLARILTPSDFGIVALGMVVVSFTNVLVDGSFGMVLIQRKEIDPEVIGASLVLSVALAVIFAGAIIAGAPLIQREFDFPQLREVLVVLGAMVPITAITTVVTALLQRAFQFGVLTLNGFVAQLAYTAVAIALALAGMGLWSLIWAQLVSFAVEALLGFLAVRRRYSVEFAASAMHDVLRSGGMFTVSKLLNWAANSVDRVVIGRFVGPAQLGFYSRAATLMSTARQLSGAGPIRVLFSSFAKMQHDPPRMAKAYIRSLSVSLIAATLTSAFIVLNSDIIVRILLGPQWSPTVPMMQILFSAFVARSGYIVAEAVPLALGLSGQSALRQGAQLVLVMIGAAVGAQFGVIGAVIGISIAYWLFYLLCLLLVQTLLPVDWLEVLRLHLNSIVVTSAPLALALACRWSLPDNDPVKLLTAAVFGIVAVAVLALAPAVLLGDDLVKARVHLWDRVLPITRRIGRSA